MSHGSRSPVPALFAAGNVRTLTGDECRDVTRWHGAAVSGKKRREREPGEGGVTVAVGGGGGGGAEETKLLSQHYFLTTL